jgi:GDP-D-mannose 3',5'-epimerase
VEWHVTGASGFIGSHMVNHLASKGEKVIAYYRTPPSDPIRIANLANADRQVQIDLVNTVPDFSTADRVLHYAADMGGVGYFHANDLWPYIANSKMTFNVLEAIGKADTPRSLLASSACAYPIQWQSSERITPALEERMLDSGTPDQMYGREKLAMIKLAERMTQDVRVGIYHTVYGIGQESEGERVKFPVAAVRKALQARTTGHIECWGTGKQRRSYLYIEEAVERTMRILTTDTYEGAVNIGREGAISCRDVFELLCELLNIDPTITYTDDQPTGVNGRDCSNLKFNRLYGSVTDIDYKTGFSRLIEWLR